MMRLFIFFRGDIMAWHTVEYSHDTAFLRLNRPPVNVLDKAWMDELKAFFDEVEKKYPEIRFVVVESELENRFSAGVSIPEHSRDLAPETIRTFHDFLKKWSRLPQLTCIRVHGYAFGGALEWLLMTDYVIAEPETKLGVPEITLAFFPPVALVYLPDKVGYDTAFHMILTGQHFTAQDLASKGWQTLLLAPINEQKERVEQLLERFRSLSCPVVELTKYSLKRFYIWKKFPELDEIERVFLHELLTYEDPEEGVRSFLEKRKPVWKNA